VNIVSEPTHSSLAQRIAKVRNRMLVEVPNTKKDLFLSLCRTYELPRVVLVSNRAGGDDDDFIDWDKSSKDDDDDPFTDWYKASR